MGSSLSVVLAPITLTNNSGSAVSITGANLSNVFIVNDGVSLSFAGSSPLNITRTGNGSPVGIQALNPNNTANLLIGSIGANTTLSLYGQSQVSGISSFGAVTVAQDLAGTILAGTTSTNVFAMGIYAGTNLAINGALSGTVAANARFNSFGLYAGSNLSIVGGITGTVTAATSLTGGVAIGLRAGASNAAGTLNGGDANTPLTIAGTVEARGNRIGVAALSQGAMNLYVTGTLSGTASDPGGSGYAIYSGSYGASLTPGNADNRVTLDGATLVGDVELGNGASTLTLLGTGSAASNFSAGSTGSITLVAGNAGGTATNWTLAPTNTSTFQTATILSNATLSINDKVAIANGGSLTLNGGTLKTTADVALGSGVSVVIGSSGGTFNTDSGTTLTIDSAISGTGTLTKTGAGTLTLGHAGNTYGDTFINAGTLKARAAGVFAPTSVVTLANVAGAALDLAGYDQTIGGLSGGGAAGGEVKLGSAVLTVQQASDTVYSGVISGTGRLVKNGAGSLALGGTNTYSGGTTIGGGKIIITNDANLGDAAGSLIFDGGTLQTAAALSSSRSVIVNAGGGALDNGGNAVSLSGSLAGAGDITLSGSGTDTLAATFDGSSYTGTATLSAGTVQLTSGAVLGGALALNAGTTLQGVGTVGNLTNSGTVSPGNSPGTITVSGNYSQSATGVYQCDLTPSSGDLLNVSGSASLDGTLALKPQYTYYATGTTWTVLSAGAGVTGTFAATTYDATPENWVFVPVYSADSVVVTLQRQSYAGSAQTTQAASVGSSLDAVAKTATGEAATLINALDYSYGTTSSTPIQSLSVIHNALTNYTLNVLSAETYDAFTQNVLDTGRTLTAVQRAGLHSGQSGSGQSYAGPMDIGPAALAALSGPPAMPSNLGLAAGDSVAPTGQLDVFLKPFGMHASQQGSSDQTGYATLAGGITGGMLYRPTTEITLGLAPGYVSQSITVHSEGGGKGVANEWSLALLGAYRKGGFYADGIARAGYNNFQSWRSLPLPTGSYRAKGTWDGWNVSLSASGGYDFTAGPVTLGPFASVSWQRLHENAFTETGAGTLGQSIRGRNNNALTTVVGGRVARTFETKVGEVTPELRLAWSAQWLGDSPKITAAFIGSPASSYQAGTKGHGYNSALVDAGVSVSMSRSLSASVRAGVELFRPGYAAQAASVGLKYTF